jgi:hypothetical protein
VPFPELFNKLYVNASRYFTSADRQAQSANMKLDDMAESRSERFS